MRGREGAAVDRQGEGAAAALFLIAPEAGGDGGAGVGSGVQADAHPAALTVGRGTEGGAGVAVVADDQPVAELARLGLDRGRRGAAGGGRRCDGGRGGRLCRSPFLTGPQGQGGGRGKQQAAKHHGRRFRRQERDAMNGQAGLRFKSDRGLCAQEGACGP